MTIEEAIKEIKEDIWLYDSEIVRLPTSKGTPDRNLIDALEMAISALKKQEPMKPKPEPIQMHVCGTELTYDLERYKCGACDAFLLYSDEEPLKTDRYCINCGQAIDWSENDGNQ